MRGAEFATQGLPGHFATKCGTPWRIVTPQLVATSSDTATEWRT